jgi:hypothetical protein
LSGSAQARGGSLITTTKVQTYSAWHASSQNQWMTGSAASGSYFSHTLPRRPSRACAVLALPEEKGKKHARGNPACIGEPLVGGYKGRGRGKHPSKRQYVSHRVSPCVTICSLRRASCPACFDAPGKPPSRSGVRGSPHSITRRRHCTPRARRQFWRTVRAGASSQSWRIIFQLRINLPQGFLVPLLWRFFTAQNYQQTHCGNLHRTVGLLPACLMVRGGARACPQPSYPTSHRHGRDHRGEPIRT